MITPFNQAWKECVSCKLQLPALECSSCRKYFCANCIVKHEITHDLDRMVVRQLKGKVGLA